MIREVRGEPVSSGGESGEVMVALMILMAVTCTGSAEVIAVTSILVYDIYQIYLKVSRGTLASIRTFMTRCVTFVGTSYSTISTGIHVRTSHDHQRVVYFYARQQELL